MVGIIVSLPRELPSLTAKKVKPGTTELVAANLLVAVAGIGSERANKTAQRLVARGATALLGWGCAGALDERLVPGTLLVPKMILAASGATFPVSPRWHERACESLPGQLVVETGPLAESESVLKTSAQKRAFGQRTGAIATDMESAAQARLAAECGIPFLALRAVADSVSTELPERLLAAIEPTGRLNAGRLIRNILFRPTDWLKIARLGRDFHAAHKTLKKARDTVLQWSSLNPNCD